MTSFASVVLLWSQAMILEHDVASRKDEHLSWRGDFVIACHKVRTVLFMLFIWRSFLPESPFKGGFLQRSLTYGNKTVVRSCEDPPFDWFLVCKQGLPTIALTCPTTCPCEISWSNCCQTAQIYCGCPSVYPEYGLTLYKVFPSSNSGEKKSVDRFLGAKIGAGGRPICAGTHMLPSAALAEGVSIVLHLYMIWVKQLWHLWTYHCYANLFARRFVQEVKRMLFRTVGNGSWKPWKRAQSIHSFLNGPNKPTRTRERQTHLLLFWIYDSLELLKRFGF